MEMQCVICLIKRQTKPMTVTKNNISTSQRITALEGQSNKQLHSRRSDRQIDRPTDRPTDRQTDKQRERERQADRQTDRRTYRCQKICAVTAHIGQTTGRDNHNVNAPKSFILHQFSSEVSNGCIYRLQLLSHLKQEDICQRRKKWRQDRG